MYLFQSGEPNTGYDVLSYTRKRRVCAADVIATYTITLRAALHHNHSAAAAPRVSSGYQKIIIIYDRSRRKVNAVVTSYTSGEKC